MTHGIRRVGESGKMSGTPIPFILGCVVNLVRLSDGRGAGAAARGAERPLLRYT